MIKRLNDQRGVAMVTVLFVGAALTAVTSAAAFTTITEFRAGGLDRQGSEALAYAEAGVDRMSMEFKRSNYDKQEFRQAGCETGPITIQGNIGNGDYRAELAVYDRATGQVASGATSAVCSTRPAANDHATPLVLAITSNGRFLGGDTTVEATQVVRQIVDLGLLGLPVGIAADNLKCRGSATIENHVVIVRGDVERRDLCALSDNNPFYRLNQFWPGWPSATDTTGIPASVHALGTIYVRNSVGIGGQEHPPSRNCDANPKGTAGQSMWDQSIPGGPIAAKCDNWVGPPSGPPPTSEFTPDDYQRVAPKPNLSDQDYLILRDSARQSGMYCYVPAAGWGQAECKRLGVDWPHANDTIQQEMDVNPILNTTDPTVEFVAYFEFETPQTVKWKADVWPCNTSPTAMSPHRSVTIVVRGGNIDLEDGSDVNGALFVPEGTLKSAGNFTLNGAVLGRDFEFYGTGTFTLDQCWVDRMPGPFLDPTMAQFHELDR